MRGDADLDISTMCGISRALNEVAARNTERVSKLSWSEAPRLAPAGYWSGMSMGFMSGSPERTEWARSRTRFEIIEDSADDTCKPSDRAPAGLTWTCAGRPHAGRLRPLVVKCLAQQRLPAEIRGRVNNGGMRVHRALLDIKVSSCGITVWPSTAAHHEHPTRSPTDFGRRSIAWVWTEV